MTFSLSSQVEDHVFCEGLARDDLPLPELQSVQRASLAFAKSCPCCAATLSFLVGRGEDCYACPEGREGETVNIEVYSLLEAVVRKVGGPDIAYHLHVRGDDRSGRNLPDQVHIHFKDSGGECSIGSDQTKVDDALGLPGSGAPDWKGW